MFTKLFKFLIGKDNIAVIEGKVKDAHDKMSEKEREQVKKAADIAQKLLDEQKGK